MIQDWTTDEVIEYFTLLESERDFVSAKAPHNRIGKVLLLKFFQYAARFPESQSEIPFQAVEYDAQQLALSN